MAGDSRVETDERAARQITALLPNGRTVWFRTAEPLAPAVSVRRLAQIAERAADRREDEALAEQLPHEPPRARAERHAHGDLALADRRARQEQVGDVRAGDEEHERDGHRRDQRALVELLFV